MAENKENVANGTAAGDEKKDEPTCPLLKRYRLLSWSTPQKNVSSRSTAFGLDTRDNLQVFVKLAMDPIPQHTLRREHRILRYLTGERYNKFLAKNQKVRLPYISDCNFADRCHFLVTQKAGTSFEILHECPDVTFTTMDLSKLAIRLLEIIEYVHENGYLHRDIHPGNVVLSGDIKTDTYKVVLIDFGTSTSYMKKKDENENHIAQVAELHPENSYKSFCTANHDNRNLSRKDDLEMIGLMLVELKEKILPCRRTKVKVGNRKRKRRHMKMARFGKPLTEICQRLELPDTFKDFIVYCRSLQFKDKPDYAYWKQEFQQLLDKNNEI